MQWTPSVVRMLTRCVLVSVPCMMLCSAAAPAVRLPEPTYVNRAVRRKSGFVRVRQDPGNTAGTCPRHSDLREGMLPLRTFRFQRPRKVVRNMPA